jgi:hypothetical protein
MVALLRNGSNIQVVKDLCVSYTEQLTSCNITDLFYKHSSIIQTSYVIPCE